MADWYQFRLTLTHNPPGGVEAVLAAQKAAQTTLEEWDSDFPLKSLFRPDLFRWRSPPMEASEYLSQVFTELGFRGTFFLAPDKEPEYTVQEAELYTYLIGPDEPYNAAVLRAQQKLGAARIEQAVQEYLIYCKIFSADPMLPATLVSTELWSRCSSRGGVYLVDGDTSNPEVVQWYQQMQKNHFGVFPIVVTVAQVTAAIREALDRANSAE